MQSFRSITTVAFLLLLAVSLGVRAEVIDRILATVDGVPLLQSDLEDSLRFEAFLQQRGVGTLTAEDRETALNRLIDQQLLREQMQGDYPVAAEEVSRQIAEIKKQCNATDDANWANLLNSYGLSEAVLRERLAERLAVMHFVDLRLRPAVHIDREAVEAYYRDTLVPQLQRMKAKIDPLSEVAPKIHELLAQQRMDQMLAEWLANLRSQSKIHVNGNARGSAGSHAGVRSGVDAANGGR